MSLTYDKAQEMVSRGASLLDEKSPGWWRTLTPESIDITHTTTCVLGCLNPNVGYLGMLYELGLDPNENFDEVIAHGFETGDPYPESVTNVNDSWRNLIATRQREDFTR